jgi:hypothetical protein
MPQASFGFDDFDKLFQAELNTHGSLRFHFLASQYSYLARSLYHHVSRVLVTMTMQPNNNSISNSSSKHSMFTTQDLHGEQMNVTS